MNPAVTTNGLTKRFGSTTAVSDLSFEIDGGQIVGFLGPNGAGKTTTIRMLMGFLNPTAGTCAVLGSSPSRHPERRGRIGYLPGDFRLDPAMTGSELFRWFGELRGRFDRGRVHELVERLDLDPDRPFGKLSKGNRQKVGLIQAFQHDPDLLILDEPTTGLDPLVQREFLRLVREAAQRGAAVLFSSHVLPEVERVASRVAIIRAGELIAMSPVDALLDHARHHLELRFGERVPEDLFREVPGVVGAEIEGHTATITVDGPVGPALRAASSGASLVRVSSSSDDLEDLFLSLYERREAR